MTLSLAEYNRLIDLASRPPQGPLDRAGGAPCSPAPTFACASIATRRAACSHLTGDALRPGVSRVNLLVRRDAHRRARRRPAAAARRRRRRAYRADCRDRARSRSTLEWGAPLTFRPGRAVVRAAGAAGRHRARDDSICPAIRPTCTVVGRLITRRSTADGRTIVEATLDPGSSTEVWWSMRDSAPSAAAREVRTLADVMTLVTLGDSDVRMVALDRRHRACKASRGRSASGCRPATS